MRIEIDWTLCDGHGLCSQLLPEQLTADEWGFPVVRDPEVQEALHEHARRAVAACPRLAMRLSSR